MFNYLLRFYVLIHTIKYNHVKLKHSEMVATEIHNVRSGKVSQRNVMVYYTTHQQLQRLFRGIAHNEEILS